jgi:ribosomal protein S15P/S13E
VLKARLSYRLAVCHMSAMSRHLQKNDKISQLEQEAARLSSALAESMASVAAKEALLLRSETSRSLAETEVQRLSTRINEMQKHILDTAKDATSATTRLEMFTKDFQVAQEAARTASGEAAEARAKLVGCCSLCFRAVGFFAPALAVGVHGCSKLVACVVLVARPRCKLQRKRKLQSSVRAGTRRWQIWLHVRPG